MKPAPTDTHARPALGGAGERIIRWCDELSRFSDHKQGLTATYCSPAHGDAARQLCKWMTSTGFDTVVIDPVGNVVGRYFGQDGSTQQLLTGSHFDTVLDGGRFDGRLGILTPMAVVQHLSRTHHRLPFDLVVIGFADEEGVRFRTSFLGSSAITGAFDSSVLDRLDDDGISMRDAMQSAGLQPDAVDSARLARTATLGYVEWHIEQGPVLLNHDLPLGIVSAINGSVRMHIELHGQSGHSGTTPMDMRRDAACAAAQFVLAVERRCSSVPELVGTVGRLEVPNGSINVVPGRCTFTLDIRAPNDAVRDAALRDLLDELQQICRQRAIESTLEETMRIPATATDSALRALLVETLTTMNLPPFELASGAGHDAMQFAGFCPLAMLFVRCGNGGISHSPLETISVEDAQLAADAFLDFVLRAAAVHTGPSMANLHE